MRRSLFCLLRCLLTTSVAIAGGPAGADTPGVIPSGDSSSVSSGQVRFYLDAAGFRAAGGFTYEEVYFLLPGDQLAFQPEAGGGYAATFSVDLCVRNAAGDTVQFKRMMRRAQVDPAGQGRPQGEMAAVLDLFPLTLRPGDFLLTLTVQDTLSGKEGVCQRRLPVPAFEGAGLTISDIEMGSHIGDAEGRGKFVKNRKQVTPNVTRWVSAGRPILYVYFEVYNLQPAGQAGEDHLSISYAVFDSSNAEVKRFPVRRVQKPGTSCAKAEALDLSGYPPGDYVLSVTAEDSRDGGRAERRRSFRLLPAQPLAQYLSVDEEALRRYYDGIKHLATQRDLDLYRSLDPEGKRTFILDFWKRRDPTPQTPENEFALEHFQRMSYADAHLGQGRVKGSDTDRGRVYVLYGPPAEVTRQTQPVEGKSYEIWSYEQGGHYEFVFIDRRGIGVFELIHATMPGEKYNPMWQSER